MQLGRRTLVDKARRIDIDGSYPRLLIVVVLGASGSRPTQPQSAPP
jgi:hypothetical protein